MCLLSNCAVEISSTKQLKFVTLPRRAVWGREELKPIPEVDTLFQSVPNPAGRLKCPAGQLKCKTTR